MTERFNIVAGVDVGTTKVCCVIAKQDGGPAVGHEIVHRIEVGAGGQALDAVNAQAAAGTARGGTVDHGRAEVAAHGDAIRVERFIVVDVSEERARVRTLVIATDEERMIAEKTAKVAEGQKQIATPKPRNVPSRMSSPRMLPKRRSERLSGLATSPIMRTWCS